MSIVLGDKAGNKVPAVQIDHCIDPVGDLLIDYVYFMAHLSGVQIGLLRCFAGT
jgi:hypothetical protein